MLQDRTWLLIGKKMAKEASADEIRELEEILRANPELHFSIQAIEEIWLRIPTHNISELDTAYAQHISRMHDLGLETPGSAKPIRSRRKYLMPAVLSVATLLTVTAVLTVRSKHPGVPQSITHASNATSSEISTRYGSKTQIVLPDGTKVWLNAGSKLTYDKSFGETLRNVALTGEAYFDVAHNAEMPFVIHTRDMDIRVLGTEFDVKSYPEERTTETSLIRGSLEVTLPNREADKIILKPNEKLVVTQDESLLTRTPALSQKPVLAQPMFSVSHLNYFSQDSTILETSWVENRLVFEDESFEELSHKLARWYGVSFDFNDDDVRMLHFTGNFRNESIEQALEAMRITADFHYEISNKTVTITK